MTNRDYLEEARDHWRAAYRLRGVDDVAAAEHARRAAQADAASRPLLQTIAAILDEQEWWVRRMEWRTH